MLIYREIRYLKFLNKFENSSGQRIMINTYTYTIFVCGRVVCYNVGRFNNIDILLMLFIIILRQVQ